MTPITTIVYFSMPNENMDKFLATWDLWQSVLVDQPGALGNVLHRTVDADSLFQFINVARWQSADALTSALRAAAARLESQGVDSQEAFDRLGVRMSQNNYVEEAEHGRST